jgi:hypothetical protein
MKKKRSKVWDEIDDYITKISQRKSPAKYIHVVASRFDQLIENFDEPEKQRIKNAKQIYHRGYLIVSI